MPKPATFRARSVADSPPAWRPNSRCVRLAIDDSISVGTVSTDSPVQARPMFGELCIFRLGQSFYTPTTHVHEECSMTMSLDFEPQRLAQSAPVRLQIHSTPIELIKFGRRALRTMWSRMASAFAARRQSPARFELRASCVRFRTPAMDSKMADKLKTQVATETDLSELDRSRHAATVARPGVRTLVRYWFRGTGPVYPSDNHLLICARGNLAAWIGARGRRVPTGSNAL